MNTISKLQILLKRSIFSILFLCVNLPSFSQVKIPLVQKIEQIAKNASGKIGVSIKLLEDGDTLNYNNQHKYVMQSVFKLAIAMKILDDVDAGRFILDRAVPVTPADFPKNYSPLRDKYLAGQTKITLRDLLSYMLTLSDNDACDILLKMGGGPKNIEAYLNRLGVKHINIEVSEQQMNLSWSAQYQNWCYPSAQVDLLEKIYRQNVLSKSSNKLLWQWLQQTSVTPNRIKGMLPQGTTAGHRSGTSATNKAGFTAATNDVGIIVLPNQKHLAIAVFVMDSSGSQVERELIIAQIAKAAFDEYSNQHH